MAAALSEARDVAARLAALAAQGGLQALPLCDAGPALAELGQAIDQLTAVQAAGVAHVHAAGVLPVATTTWLANNGLSKGAASSLLALSCSVAQDYAATGAAWVAGSISRAHASTITQSVDTVARGLAHDDQAPFRAMAEKALLDYALDGATPAQLVRAARKVRAWVDAWGMNKDANEAERAQFIRFTEHGDGIKVEGYLTPENHALIALALEQAIDLRHRAGTLPEEDRVAGDDPASKRAKRRRQTYLNVIALVDVCGALLENGDLGGKHGAIPRVTVDVDLHDLHAWFGTLRHPAAADGTVIDGGTLRRLLCDAEVSAVLATGARPRCTCGCPSCGCQDSGPSLDDLLREANKAVVYVGRAERVVPPRLRRALETREHGRCGRPGCGVPASRCRAHHVEHWEDGGPTDIDNCLLVCERHHRDLHAPDGWRVEPDPAKTPYDPGYFSWIPPGSRRRP